MNLIRNQFNNRNWKILITVIISLHVTPGVVLGQSGWDEQGLQVLDEPADRMMEDYMIRIIDHQFMARDRLLTSLKTPEDWKGHIKKVRDFIVQSTGPFPERTVYPVGCCIYFDISCRGLPVSVLG